MTSVKPPQILGFGRVREHQAWFKTALGVLFISLLLLLPLLSNNSNTQAAQGINEQLNFQARLLEDDGSLVDDGFYNIRFKIYCGGDGDLVGAGSGADCTHAENEDLLWTEEWYDSNGVTAGNDNRVRVVNGYISVQLNALNADFSPIDWNEDELWLTIDIGGTAQTATPTYDGEMEPFIRFTSVPYAFNSDQLDGLDSTDFVQLGQGVQGDSTNNVSVFINKTGTGNLLELQDSGTTELVFDQGAELTLGSDSDDGALTLSDGSSNYVTFNQAALSSDITLTWNVGSDCTGNANGGTLTVNGSNQIVCDDDDGGAGGGNTLQQAYTSDADGGDAVIVLTSADGAIVVRDNSTPIGDLFVVEADGGSDYLTVNPSAVTIGTDLVVTAGNSLTLTGGNTASRPGSPTEGMVYFDTDTDQLLVYSEEYPGSSTFKWKAYGGEYLIVAANDSTDREKAAADYLADGTSDEAEINNALSDASGGKVVLLAGTYSADATISVPNNTTLTGVGSGTVINSSFGAVSDNLIQASGASRTGQVIRDLTIDGSEGTGGTQHGIVFTSVGATASDRAGATVINVAVENFRHNGIELNTSDLSTITNSTFQGNGQYGIYLVTSDDNVISNNFMNNTGTDGMVLNSADGNTINGNISRNNGDGYHVYNGSDYNTFTGNTGSNNSAYGFYLQTSNDFNTFSGNVARSNSSAGFWSVTSTGNTFSGNTSSANTNYGFVITTGSHRSALTGNYVSNNGTRGIYLNEADDTAVIGNSVYDNGGGTANNGIFINNSDRSNVTGNQIVDTSCSTTCYAINISGSGSDDTYLADNTFDGGATINDAGTGTVYANQLNEDLDSATADLVIQAPDDINLNSDTVIDGTLIVNSQVTINENGDNVDFRVESDTITDALQVNGAGGTLVFGAYDCTGNANGGALTADASGNITCTDDDGGGTGEFTDATTYLYPTDNSGAQDIVIGGTTTGAADIWLQATGAAVFNEQGADADFRVEGDTDEYLLFVDASADTVGINTSDPSGDGFGTPKLSISEEVAGGIADISLQAGATLETQAIFRANANSSQVEVGSTTSDKLIFYTNALSRALFTSADGDFLVADSGDLTDGAYGKLEVRGTDNNIVLNPALGGTTRLAFYEGNAASIALYYDGSGTGDSNKLFVRDDANSVNRVTFERGGNVGIGDTTPASLLTVGNGDLFQVNSSGAITAAAGITSSGTITFSALDCTGNANGGALTTNGSGVLSCSDDDGAGTPTLQDVYDNGSAGDQVLALSSTNDSIIFRNPSSSGTDSGYIVNIDQLNTGGVDGLRVNNAGTGNLLGLYDDSTLVTSFADGGHLLANNASTATTGNTESTSRTDVTSITLDADSFDVDDVIFFDNAGQDYFTRITVDNTDGTYTVSPAVSYDADVTVTKYDIQNIGATATDYATLSNRFFQGYFLGGVVTGAGSTTLSDGLLHTTGDLRLQSGSYVYNTPDASGTLVLTAGEGISGGSQSFSTTGSEQQWVVPNGVTEITVEAAGASGGDGQNDSGTGGTGGAGALVTTTMAVTPGETLYIYVGGTGSVNAGGFNGGGAGSNYYGAGGGGASDIRQSGNALADRVIVAGGGGGGGGPADFNGNDGGDGGYAGDPDGADGASGQSLAEGGYGATTTAGGAGSNSCGGASAGTLGVGGDARVNSIRAGGGGGGGGLYGGGGGEACGNNLTDSGAGGGGGSSLTTAGGDITGATNVGDGYVDISWSGSNTSGYIPVFGSDNIIGDSFISQDVDTVYVSSQLEVTNTATFNGSIVVEGGAIFNETGADVDFRIESDTHTDALQVRGSDGQITLGALDCTGNANGGALTANASGVLSCTDDDDSASSVTLQSAYSNGATGDQVIALSSANDSIILRNPSSSGTDSGFVLTVDQLSTGATGGLLVSSAGSGNLFQVTDTTATARDVLTIANGGATTFRNQTDSTAGLLVQDAAGSELFSVDTSNGRVQVGDPSADATGTLLVVDTKNTAGDPTGVNGAIYYNSDSGKFRCYESGAWKDCITPTGGSGFSGVKVDQATSTTLVDSAFTAVGFDAEDFDTDNYHDNSTNNTRLTAPVDGYYQIGGTISLTSLADQDWFTVAVRVNGSTRYEVLREFISTAGSDDKELNFNDFQYLDAGDYVEIEVYNASGANEDTNTARTRVYMYQANGGSGGGGSGSGGASGSYYRTTDLTIPTTTNTDVDMEFAQWDPENWFNASTGEIDVPEGKYLVGINAQYDDLDSTEYNYGIVTGTNVTIANNSNSGNAVWRGLSAYNNPSAPSRNSGSLILEVGAGGGSIKMQVRQTSGSDRTIIDAELWVVQLDSVFNGSSGAVFQQPIDVYKTTTDTPDDEFNSPALDGKWTLVNGSAGTVDINETGNVEKYDLQTRPGWLLTQAGGSGTDVVEMRQDWTLADGDSIVTSIATGTTFDDDSAGSPQFGQSNGEIGSGIVLNSNDATHGDYNTAGRIELLATEIDDGEVSVQFFVKDNVNTTITLNESGTAEIGEKIYLRINRSGTTYYGFYSLDGSSWVPLGSGSPGGSALDNFWLINDNDAVQADPVPIVGFDWVRQGGSGLDPWPINWRAGASNFGDTLQSAYDNDLQGAADIVTTDGKDLKVTLSDTTTDADLVVDIVGEGQFLIQDNGSDALSVDGSGNLNLLRDGIATAGTQYNSQDLVLQGSVWDSTNTQAEDRQVTLRVITGSGTDGNEPYRLAILNDSGNEIASFDGANERLQVGNPTPDSTGTLLVVDTKNTAGDPTGVNGAIYYNSDSGKFRCYESGAWKDCITPTGGSGFSGASAYRATAQNITNNSWVAVQLDNENYDTDAYHDNSTNNTRLYAPYDGYYIVDGQIGYDGDSNGDRLLQFRVNGTAYNRGSLARVRAAVDWYTHVNASDVLFLNAGDYVELLAYQSTSGNLDVVEANATITLQNSGFGGGGGSAIYQTSPADKPPTTANAQDDEFDDENFNSTKWTWRNQGSATATEQPWGTLNLTAPGSASDDLRILEQDVPASTPWTATAKLGAIGELSDFQQAGLVLVDSVSGELVTLSMRANADAVTVQRWNSVTSWSANQITRNINGNQGMLYLRVEDDGTDINFYVSPNGADWGVPIYSEGRTAFLNNSPDKVGFFANSDNSQDVTLTADWFRVDWTPDYSANQNIASGNGAVFQRPIDVYKTTTDTPDDEFNSPALDGKWTAVDGTAGTVDITATGNQGIYDLQTRPGWLMMQPGTGTSDDIELRQDFTLADGDSIVMGLTHSLDYTANPTNNELWYGLVFNDADTAPYDGEDTEIHFDTQSSGYRVYHLSDGGVTAEGADSFNEGTTIGGKVYLRVDRSGLDYTSYYSTDGTSWIPLGAFTATGALDNLWIVAKAEAGMTTAPIVGVDWIRQGDGGALDPWPINWRAGASSFGDTLQSAYDNDLQGAADIVTTDGKDLVVSLSDTTTDASLIVDIIGTNNTFEIRDDGTPVFTVADGGQLTANGGAIFNELGADVDFRVESDVNENTLFVQGSDGFIGLGTNAPAFNVHSVYTGTTYFNSDTYGSGTVFQGRRANGTPGSETAIATGNLLSQFGGRGYDTVATDWTGTRGAITFNARENWTGTAQGTGANIYVTPINSTSLHQALNITSDDSTNETILTIDTVDAADYSTLSFENGGVVEWQVESSPNGGNLAIIEQSVGVPLNIAAGGATTLAASTDSDSIFTVQDAGGQDYLTVDSESSTDVLKVAVGEGTDDVVFAFDAFTTDPSGTVPDGSMFYDSDDDVFRCRINGSWANCDGAGGGDTIRRTLYAEYGGGTLFADGSNNNGTMSAGYDSTNRHNYYDWDSSQGTLQDYDIVIHTSVPSDFTTSNDTSWYIYALANSTSSSNNEISVTVYEGATACNTTDNLVADSDITAANTWTEVNLGSMSSCTFNADDTIRIEIKMSSLSNNNVQVGEIRWDYDN